MSKTKILALAVLVVGCSGAAANEPMEPTAPVTQGPQDQNPNDGGTVGDAGGDASATFDASDASKTPDVGSPDAGGSCATRKGGAFITFQVGNEVLTVWSTNTKFNQEAFLASAQGKQVTPVFKKLVDGFDCDGQWTWHVDPEDLAFGDGADASCNGLPSAIEANKNHWLTVVGRFCPAKVMVSGYQGT